MTDTPTHIHLDALGGVAGDMFLAAAFDAAPQLLDEATALARAVCPGLELVVQDVREQGLTGKRITMNLPSSKAHGPRHYPDYLALFQAAPTDAGVIARASDVLRRLGLAEAKVHGVPLEQVHFHEVADWDSVVDILLSALMIERLNAQTASASALPLGSGRVTTEHGSLSVPAPATLEILKGARWQDDGVPGERVTPTGAAIISHLCVAGFPPGGATLDAIGYGFGARDLGSIANVLRLSLFHAAIDTSRDTVGVIVFHVDDQTAEDLAVGLSRIRAHEHVIDVQQMVSYGKKNRIISRVEVLCDPVALETVAWQCFHETTTIGLRFGIESRLTLTREEKIVPLGDANVRMKTSLRPGMGPTTKPEMDDIAGAGDRIAREALRQVVVDRSKK